MQGNYVVGPYDLAFWLSWRVMGLGVGCIFNTPDNGGGVSLTAALPFLQIYVDVYRNPLTAP